MFSFYAYDGTFKRMMGCNNAASSPTELRGKEEITISGVAGAVAEDAALTKVRGPLIAERVAKKPACAGLEKPLGGETEVQIGGY